MKHRALPARRGGASHRGRRREIGGTRVLVAVSGSRSRQAASRAVVQGKSQGDLGTRGLARYQPHEAVDAASGGTGAGRRGARVSTRNLSWIPHEARDRGRRSPTDRYDSRRLWILERLSLHRGGRERSSPCRSMPCDGRKVGARSALGRTKPIGGACRGSRETSEVGSLRERLVQSPSQHGGAAGQHTR